MTQNFRKASYGLMIRYSPLLRPILRPLQITPAWLVRTSDQVYIGKHLSLFVNLRVRSVGLQKFLPVPKRRFSSDAGLIIYRYVIDCQCVIFFLHSSRASAYYIQGDEPYTMSKGHMRDSEGSDWN